MKNNIMYCTNYTTDMPLDGFKFLLEMSRKFYCLFSIKIILLFIQTR